MQILTNSSTSTRALVQRPPAAKATPLPKANLDSVSFGVFQPASKHMGAPQNPKKSNKWKGALIGGAAGALIGGVGGAIGGSVGSVATAPVVAFMGGAAAASTYTFRGNGKTMTAQAEARSVFTRVAGAGLAGAAVVALGAHGGWVGAVAAGLGGLATGAALGYGLGS